MKAVKFSVLLITVSFSLSSLKSQDIAAARYAPPGMYMKDHNLFYEDGTWHLFAPLGPVGTMWWYEGSEEGAEHMTSEDLVNWKHIGTAVPASKREGYFDGIMGGIAPFVVKNGEEYLMFYAVWDFKSKNPRNMEGFRQGIGIAMSKDLIHWEKPAEFAKDGLAPKGSDQCVVRDQSNDRWLLYVGRSGAVAVYQCKDLLHWQEAGLALTEAELKTGYTGMNPGESPFVMKHPISGIWIIFMNGGFSVSNDPLKFPPITPYPFKSGIFTFPNPHDEGKGTFYHADDDGAGFAHEIIEFKGLCALGGAATDARWEEGALVEASLKAGMENSFNLRLPESAKAKFLLNGKPCRVASITSEIVQIDLEMNDILDIKY